MRRPSLGPSDAAAALLASPALAHLGVSAGWTLRFAGASLGEAELAALLTACSTSETAALVALAGERDGGERHVLLEMRRAAPRRAATAPGAPDERAAEAARFCDGLATRLASPRSAVRARLDWPGAEMAARVGAQGRERAALSTRVEARWRGARLAIGYAPALDPAAESELLFAIEETRAALGVDAHPRLPHGSPAARGAALRAWPERDGFSVAIAARPAPRAAPDAARRVAEEAGRRGAHLVSATLAIGDAQGARPVFARRPEIAARIVALWLERPGLARALRLAGDAPGLLDGVGPDHAAELDVALAALSSDEAAPSGRLGALARLLEGAELGIERDEDGGGARLAFRGLAPPGSADGLAAVEALCLAIAARAASDVAPARAPADLGAARDRFDLPSTMWADLVGAVVELSGDVALSPEWFADDFEARHPIIAETELRGLRLRLREARETAPGARRLEALIESPRIATVAARVDGRAAPLARCPLTAGRVFGLRFQAAAHQAAAATGIASRFVLDFRDVADDRPMGAVALTLDGRGGRLDPCDPPASVPDRARLRMQATLDLRAPAGPA